MAELHRPPRGGITIPEALQLAEDVIAKGSEHYERDALLLADAVLGFAMIVDKLFAQAQGGPIAWRGRPSDDDAKDEGYWLFRDPAKPTHNKTGMFVFYVWHVPFRGAQAKIPGNDRVFPVTQMPATAEWCRIVAPLPITVANPPQPKRVIE